MASEIRQTESVREFFGSKSQEWGQPYLRDVREISELDLVLRRRVALTYLARVREREGVRRLSILDVGCASGEVLSGLDPSAWQVFGVDLVEDMVRQAKRFARISGLAVADAVNLPFPDECLDVVSSLGVLEYVPNWTLALQGMVRVLKAGGRLVISFPNRQSVFRKLGRLEGRILRKVSRLGRRCSKSPTGAWREWSRVDAVNALVARGLKISDFSYVTFGFKGRLGDRSTLNLRCAQRMPASRPGTDPIASRLGWTMVFLCTKR